MARRILTIAIVGILAWSVAPSAFAQEEEDEVAPVQSPVVLPELVEPEVRPLVEAPREVPAPAEVKAEELALTGSDVLLPLALATALVGGGALFVAGTRRRRAAAFSV